MCGCEGTAKAHSRPLSLSLSLSESRLGGHCGERPGGQTAPHKPPARHCTHPRTHLQILDQDSSVYSQNTARDVHESLAVAKFPQVLPTRAHAHIIQWQQNTKKRVTGMKPMVVRLDAEVRLQQWTLISGSECCNSELQSVYGHVHARTSAVYNHEKHMTSK